MLFRSQRHVDRARTLRFSSTLTRPRRPVSLWPEHQIEKLCARPPTRSSSFLPCLIIRLIIQTIRRVLSGSDGIEEAPNLSRADPSGTDQSDAEHQSTDLAVGDSIPRGAPAGPQFSGLVGDLLSDVGLAVCDPIATLLPRSPICACDSVRPRTRGRSRRPAAAMNGRSPAY